MQTTFASTSLTCAFLPCQGSRGTLDSSFRRLQWRSLSFFWTPKNKLACFRKWSQKACQTQVTAELELRPPPYSLDSLEPHMSRETIEYHWGKHHRGYVENLNRQIAGTELEEMTLEDIVIATYNKGNILPAFNNAAQVWNHDFFWESMKPGGGGKPSGDLLEMIQRDFGSYEGFLREFMKAASTQFGSGWAWLAYKANRLNIGNAVHPNPSEDDKKLVVVKSPNAVNPLVWDYSVSMPLLTIDVWEHAYYLDYLSQRTDFISIFMEKLVSWEAVSLRLEMAKARALEREREEERRRREEEEEEEDENPMEDKEDMEMYLDSENEELETE